MIHGSSIAEHTVLTVTALARDSGKKAGLPTNATGSIVIWEQLKDLPFLLCQTL